MFGFRLFGWKLKTYYWKYYNKIFFIIENTVHAFFITWLEQGQKKCNAHKLRNAATQTHTDSETLFQKKKKKKWNTDACFSALSKRRLHVSHLKVPKCIESLRLLLTNMFDWHVNYQKITKANSIFLYLILLPVTHSPSFLN